MKVNMSGFEGVGSDILFIMSTRLIGLLIPAAALAFYSWDIR
jgi:hypothetical protein